MIDPADLEDALRLIGAEHAEAVAAIVDRYRQARRLADQAPTVSELQARLAALGTAARRLAAEIGQLDRFTTRILDPTGEAMPGDDTEVDRYAEVGQLEALAGRAAALGTLADHRLRRVDAEISDLGSIGRRRADAILPGGPPRWRLVESAVDVWRAAGRRAGTGEASACVRFVELIVQAAGAPGDGIASLVRRRLSAERAENNQAFGMCPAASARQSRHEQRETSPCPTM